MSVETSGSEENRRNQRKHARMCSKHSSSSENMLQSLTNRVIMRQHRNKSLASFLIKKSKNTSQFR